jgi:5-methylcytosine-specific restriction protein B
MTDRWEMTEAERTAAHQQWREFREQWPIERLKTMRLEDYTNLEKDQAFIYVLEAKLDGIGSIWGNTAFKFGIYRRRPDGKQKESSATHVYGQEYAWLRKYGSSEEEAFETVRARIVATAEAAALGDYEAIDRIDFFPLVKWKLAFIYQDPEQGSVFPIYSAKVLLWLYQHLVDPAAKKDTAYSLRYQTIREKFADQADLIQLGRYLWNLQSNGPDRYDYWALNVTGWDFDAQARELTSSDLPADFHSLFENEDIELEVGNHLAILSEDRVIARARIKEVRDDEVVWTQELFDVSAPFTPRAGLHPIKTRKHRQQIWGAGTGPEPGPGPKPRPTVPTTNTILYGPPGTGKTYSTVERALELILGSEATSSMTRDTATKQFRSLQQEGRIELVTFHQAYGYEEFVEGLRPVLGDSTGDVRYELHPGIFKRIAMRASAGGLRTEGAAPEFDTLWKVLVERVREDEDRVLKSASGREYVLRVNAQDNFESYALDVSEEGEPIVSDRRQVASKSLSRIWWTHREHLGKPASISYENGKEVIRRERGGDGGHHYTAVWIVHRELLLLRDELEAAREEAAPTPAQVQEALDRTTPGRLDFEFTGETAQYVLVIDEINRGNISKILGELITLLEPDKRLSMPNELKLPLAYSPTHRFAVPPNLHIVGTMNTADRSIALMDVALRRRFEFEEVMPDAAALRKVLGARVDNSAFVDLVVDLFETLNRRIRFLHDREHQLGHAYLMAATSPEELRRVLRDRLVPLLQEYFYGSWDKIAAVLGCPYDDDGKPLRQGVSLENGRYRAPLIEVQALSEREILGFDQERYDGLLDYRVTEALRGDGEVFLPYFLGVLDDDAIGKHRNALGLGA